MLFGAFQTLAQIDEDNCYFQIEPVAVDVNSADYDVNYGYRSTI